MLSNSCKRYWLSACLLLSAGALTPMTYAAQAEDLQRYERMLKAQGELIESLAARVTQLEASLADDGAGLETAVVQPTVRQDAPLSMHMDEVGDLNAFVREGENPGSILLPGPANVSIGFGGFVKSLAYADSDSETVFGGTWR